MRRQWFEQMEWVSLWLGFLAKPLQRLHGLWNKPVLCYALEGKNHSKPHQTTKIQTKPHEKQNQTMVSCEFSQSKKHVPLLWIWGSNSCESRRNGLTKLWDIERYCRGLRMRSATKHGGGPWLEGAA